MLLPFFMVAACSSDDDNASDITNTLQLPVSEIIFEAAGGTESFSINGASPFVRSSEDWVTISRKSQDSKSSLFEVVCQANDSHDERSATLLVNQGGNKGEIAILQRGKAIVQSLEKEIDPQATAMSIAQKMYPGWNLGNTFEATSGTVGLGDETGWQSTRTTQEIIDFVKQQGFRSVRIPCSWHRHMNANNIIDAEWIARVKEVVEYCLRDELYVVLNDHYDEAWIETHMDTYDANRATLMKILWTQVATAFGKYDEHLLFAGLNEPNADTQAKTDNLVRYEQDFVDAVRATGGNNSYRTLVVQGPSTDIDNTSKYYKTLPSDKIQDRLMVEVHFYSPWNFAGMEEDASWGKMFYFWGAENHVTGSDHNATWGEEQYVADQMQKLKTQFVDKGIPVYIGEYGCQWRSIGSNQDKHDASVRLFHKLVNKEAIDHGCIPVLWDINYCQRNGTKGNMTVLNRATLQVWNSYAMEGITEGVAEAKWNKQ